MAEVYAFFVERCRNSLHSSRSAFLRRGLPALFFSSGYVGDGSLGAIRSVFAAECLERVDCVEEVGF